MNYDLAKKLKDAGFPQEGNGEYWTDEGLPAVSGIYEGKLYVPTLSELMEECGYKFKGIWKHKRKAPNPLEPWSATARMNPGKFRKVFGKTPEEAVANLWLMLKEK